MNAFEDFKLGIVKESKEDAFSDFDIGSTLIETDPIKATKQMAGTLLSTLPIPAGAVAGAMVANLGKEDYISGAQQALLNVHEEEKQIKDIVDTSEQTGISPARLSRWQRIVNYLKEKKESGLSVMGPFDVWTSQDPAITEGPGMKITKDIAAGKGLKYVPGALARGTESLIGAAGTLVQQAWETASMGNFLAKQVFQIDTPGAGMLAEYIIRKHGPEKAVEIFDKKKAKYAEQGVRWANWWEEQAGKGWEAPDPELMVAKWDRAVEYGTSVTMESAPTFAAAITAGYITGNPNIGLAIMGMFEKMNSYRNQRKKGVDIRTADIISTLSGAWEAGTEKLPFDFLMKGNTSKIAKAVLGGPIEAAQELIAGMGQNFLEYFGYEAKDWESIPAAAKEGLQHTFDNWLESVVAGWSMGSGAGIAIPSGGSTMQEIEKTSNRLNIPIEGLSPEDAIDKIGRVTKSRKATEEKVEKVMAEPPTADPVKEAHEELAEARKPIRAITEGMAQADIASIETAIAEKAAKVQSATEKLQTALNTEAQQAEDALDFAAQAMQNVDIAKETIEENVDIIKTAQEMIRQLQQPIVARQEGQMQADIESIDAQLAERERLIKETEDAIDRAEQKVNEAETVLEANKKPTEPLQPVKDGLNRGREILARAIGILRPKEEKERLKKPPSKPVKAKTPAKPTITPAKSPVVPKAKETKQPWEMTFSQYHKSFDPITWSEGYNWQSKHETQVENAIKQGKPVPREVLEEYKGEKWADEALAEAEGAGEKIIYTSTPKEWNVENDLYDWGGKGLRSRGNRKIGNRKTFVWQSEFGKVPVRLTGMKRVLESLRARTDEVFKVHNKKGEDCYLAPPKVIEEVKAELGEEAFKQRPKPERSPKQLINDAINSMKRHGHDDAEIGAFIEGFAKELGLTEKDYSANINKYIEALNNDPEVDKLRKSFQSGMEEKVPTTEEELEERRAIQEEGQLTEEIGDFLDGIAEEKPQVTPAKPKTEAGFIEVEKAVDAMKAPGRWFLSVFEPAKLTARAHGKESVATVIRAFHKPEMKVLEYGAKELEALDMSYNQVEEWFGKYPKEIQEAVMLTRGHGLEAKARALQKKAFASLPKELKDSKIRRAIDEIADFNYEYLSEVFGEEVETLFGTDVVNVPGYVRDYFYGVYKDPKKINNFLSFWKTTDKYTKHKVFPTYADAKAYGLEVKNPNPVTNLKAEYRAISYKASMMWLKGELMRLGKGKYIMPKDEALVDWEHIGGREYADPTFSDVLLEPSMAKLVNNLISTNKISQFKPLKILRDINNFLRTIKFIGSAFHMVSIAKQSVADSGYIGFYKPTATRGFTKGFEKSDPIFQTSEYKWYVENGGGHQYAVESEARRTFEDIVSKLTKNEQYIVKIGSAPLKFPVGFVNWMFNSYIPKVKYAKYLDVVAQQEKKLNRSLTAAETQEIIKEQQNFYGMMNERLFGRSGTVTGALRFVFIAPGYAEGNYRTMIKAVSQWGQGEEGFGAGRSRMNILNSWIVSATLATVGTMILTGKPPEKPETIEEYRDLLKINTGKKDEYGNDIMIDLATYDRDYWDVAFNSLRGRPDIAIGNAMKRIGGMKAPTAKIMADLFSIMQGKTLWDWKDDKVYHITDPLLLKINKLITHEVRELLPISASVYKRSREMGIDRATAAIEMLLGFRPGRTERDKKEFEIVRDIWDMRDKREKLSYKINSYNDPWGAVNLFNKTLDNIADNKFITEEIKGKIDSLRIDPEKVITWKRFPIERLSVEQIQESIKEHTYKRYYKDDKGKVHRRHEPHKGYEDRVKDLRNELKKR